MHLLDELVRLAGVRPVPCSVASGADLRHDVQLVRVRVQGLTDDLVGDVRAVEVGRVDVGDAEFHRGAEDPDRLVTVGGRAEHAGAGELHGAVADPGQVEVVSEAEGAAGEGRRAHAHHDASAGRDGTGPPRPWDHGDQERNAGGP